MQFIHSIVGIIFFISLLSILTIPLETIIPNLNKNSKMNFKLFLAIEIVIIILSSYLLNQPSDICVVIALILIITGLYLVIKQTNHLNQNN